MQLLEKCMKDAKLHAMKNYIYIFMIKQAIAENWFF